MEMKFRRLGNGWVDVEYILQVSCTKLYSYPRKKQDDVKTQYVGPINFLVFHRRDLRRWSECQATHSSSPAPSDPRLSASKWWKDAEWRGKQLTACGCLQPSSMSKWQRADGHVEKKD